MEQGIVLITGASRGIGRAIAVMFARKHYDLVLTCQSSKNELEQLKQELEQSYCISCRIVIGDMGDEAVISEMFQSIENVDILINNAGISYHGLLQDMSLNDWNHIMQTNMTSAFLCSKYSIPLMLKKHAGKIINISSVWGHAGASYEVAYSASKGALHAFTKALAKELAPSGIQVNAVACGLIDTDMNQNLSEEERDIIIEEIPSCRIGQTDDIAKTVYMLCTGSDYITGQILTVDGGWIG
ncbi:MAG: 3-oxoacyl-ACP reductase FabG [Clostridia bacterium]|nr:3-oxoacyl-ACP reductase FabG [Clostridia bacterium]